jgi:hypothetical protein
MDTITGKQVEDEERVMCILAVYDDSSYRKK